ncbi:MAG: extracellular solute-binding protein [Parvibaculaceae bacterium]
MNITRRQLVKLGAAGLACSGIPALAQAKEVYFVTYPGSIDEAFKKIVGPAYQQATGSTVVFTPMLNTDLIGKIKASQANPPFDASLFDDGPLITVIRDQLVDKFSAEDFPVLADVPDQLRNASGYGPAVALSAVGIAYNPTTVSPAPTSWEDLWKPQFKGRVGIVGPASTLGTTFLVEVAKMRGGSETDVEAAFAAYRDLLPQLGAIAPSPGALATMFQQGQVDIAPQYFNNVAALRSRGVDIAFAKPKEGLQLQTITICMIANSKNREAANALLNTIFDQKTLTAFEADPYVIIPTHSKVKLTGQNATLARDVHDLLAQGSFLNWANLVDKRPGWVDRFNREIKM